VEWKLTEAKNRFSEVFRLALKDGPQRITRHGNEAVFVLSESEYCRLKGDRPDFIEFLLNGPDLSELELPSRDWTIRETSA
jgi:antitoxin Phd